MDGYGTRNKYGDGLWVKVKHSDQDKRYESDSIYEALIPLNEDGVSKSSVRQDKPIDWKHNMKL